MDYQRQSKNQKAPKSSAANTLRIISIIIIILTTAGGGVAGYAIGYSSGYKTWYGDRTYNEFIGLLIGVAVGFVIGFFATLLFRYFAELGENIKKTANASMKQVEQGKEKMSETDQIMMYKELLDNGAITQEEFDKMKKELLKI